jgi:hypothetical protein
MSDLAFPLLLMMFSMDVDKTFYLWLREPATKGGTPLLLSPPTDVAAEWGLTTHDDLITSVNRWYDARQRTDAGVALVSGRVLLDQTQSGHFQRVFVLEGGNEAGTSRPLLHKYISDVQEELVSIFNLSETESRQVVAELERTGHAEASTSVDESLAKKLVNKR